jgi:hypothetical protein
MGIYSDEFSDIFSNLLEKYDVSCYKIHKYSHLDQGFLSHLRNGQKLNPSPETILKIALTLVHNSSKIKVSEINQLFKAVGRSLNIKDFY